MNCKFVAFFIALFLAFPGCSDSDKISIRDILDGQNFRRFNFDRSYVPSAHELSLIHYILKHTYENNIHKMRGESKNRIYFREEKDEYGYSEAVYDENGDLVTNSYNRGSFNYYLNKTEPIKHFGYDILPWLEWGNTRDDPTCFVERLHHYILDLNIGIQTYIFEGSVSDFTEIDYSKFPREEQLVYQFFCHVLFNKDYSIKLDEDNRERLKQDGDFYWQYMGQIQKLLGVDKFE